MLTPGRLIPFRSLITPPLTTRHRAAMPSVLSTRSSTDTVGEQNRIAGLLHRGRTRRSWWKPPPPFPRPVACDREHRSLLQDLWTIFEGAEPYLRALQVQENSGVSLELRSQFPHRLNSPRVIPWVPCEAFSRNTSTPASNKLRRTASESVDGPSVATILVAGMLC